MAVGRNQTNGIGNDRTRESDKFDVCVVCCKSGIDRTFPYGSTGSKGFLGFTGTDRTNLYGIRGSCRRRL